MTEVVAWLGLSIMIGFFVVLVLLIYLLLREIFREAEQDDEH